MICTKCNSEINDNSNFCPVCGLCLIEPATDAPNAPVAPVATAYDPVEEQVKASALKTMIFGIVSLATVFFSGMPILGIIFGIITKKQNAIYESLTEKANTKALVGAVLGKVGFWFGLAYTLFYICVYVVFFLIYFTMFFTVTSQILHF